MLRLKCLKYGSAVFQSGVEIINKRSTKHLNYCQDQTYTQPFSILRNML